MEQSFEQAVKNAFNPNATIATENKAETPTIENKIETPEAKVETPEKEVASVAKEEQKVTPKEEPKVETKIKSFEDELTERSGGKYKSFDDIKKDLETPKGDTFFDDEIRHLNELKKNGVTIDREFLELQAKNFDKLNNLDLHIEALKLKPENKGLSDKTLAVKINKQYNIEEWVDKAEEDMTDEDRANKEMFEHEANINKESLIKYKNERILFKKPDEAASKAMAEEARAKQDAWEKQVDNDLEAKTEKFSSEIEDKDTKEKIVFDFKLSDEDKKEASSVMKQLPSGLGAYIGKHITKDAEGNVQINHAGVYQDYLKAKNFDKAVASALEYGKEQGKLLAEKHAKNTNFSKSEAGVINPEKVGMAEAVRKASIY